MSTTKSTDLTRYQREEAAAWLQGIAGANGLAQLGNFCASAACAQKSLEGDYLQRVRAVEAKLLQFPKVMASPLGQEFQQIKTYLNDSLTKLRTGNYATTGTGFFRSKQTPYEIEKQAYANHLRLAQIDAAVLTEAQRLNDAGVQLDPAVQAALTASGTALTPGEGPLPSPNQPINWWLWGGVGAGVLAVGSALWFYARRLKQTQGASAIAGLNRRKRRKSRSSSR